MSTRRRFETGDRGGTEPPVIELQQQEELNEAPELGEQVEEEPSAEMMVAAEPQPPLPVAWLWSQQTAMLRKPSGAYDTVEAGQLLPTYSWLPIEPGVVAVNLGERGKWWIQMGEWVVYYRG